MNKMMFLLLLMSSMSKEKNAKNIPSEKAKVDGEN